MKQIYTHLPTMYEGKPDPFRIVKRSLLPIWFWLVAHITPVPGLFIHRYVFQIAIRLWLRGQLHSELRDRVFVFPLDSVRYFEFDFMWKSLSKKPLGRYLDLSSPRLLAALLLDKTPLSNAVFVNPDENDLSITRNLIETLGFGDRCTFVGSVVEDLDFPDETFDTITSVSVIEHIPGDGDQRAVAKLWKLLRPGGRFFLSVPCAAEAMEEYIDCYEYGVLTPDENNFVFGQRFYDKKSLCERIFKVAGQPTRISIYGEKHYGTFIQNREQKISKPGYPYWREPYMMGKCYDYYSSINDLPGWGVVAMEFCKRT